VLGLWGESKNVFLGGNEVPVLKLQASLSKTILYPHPRDRSHKHIPSKGSKVVHQCSIDCPGSESENTTTLNNWYRHLGRHRLDTKEQRFSEARSPESLSMIMSINSWETAIGWAFEHSIREGWAKEGKLGAYNRVRTCFYLQPIFAAVVCRSKDTSPIQ